MNILSNSKDVHFNFSFLSVMSRTATLCRPVVLGLPPKLGSGFVTVTLRMAVVLLLKRQNLRFIVFLRCVDCF